MSILSTVASAIPSGLRILARLVGIKPGKELPEVVRKHYYPDDEKQGTAGILARAQVAEVGLDRCYYCLRYDPKHTLVTKPGCPRRRPSQVELP